MGRGKGRNKAGGRLFTGLAAGIFLAAALLFGAPQGENAQDSGADTEQGSSRSKTGDSEAAQELEVHFLDVGQGDSTLFLCGAEAMLIDAGDNDQGTRIQDYLEKQGVETLKYVVCTHPDADHIGGVDVILYKFNCETVFMTQEERDTATYRDVADTMRQKGYSRTQPETGKQYPLGDAVFTILAPSAVGSDSNNNSIGILLTHGDNTFLFTGDAEEEEESEFLASGISLEADVYKAGHHGSRSSSSGELLEAVSPSFAVISCGEGNSYGHPHAETLNELRAMGVQVYRTDEQGTVIAVSDGSKITWNCSPSETWQAGEPTGSRADTVSYICNTNTRKFHYPDCSSVEQMDETNMLPTSADREELIRQGYEPCGICRP